MLEPIFLVFVSQKKKKKNPPKNQLNCHNEIAKSIHSKEIPYMYTHTHTHTQKKKKKKKKKKKLLHQGLWQVLW